jgi:hypothetical protein
MSTTAEQIERKSSDSGLENRNYGRRGSAALTTRHHLSAKVGTNFADKRQSLGDSGHGVRVCLLFYIPSSSVTLAIKQLEGMAMLLS